MVVIFSAFSNTTILVIYSSRKKLRRTLGHRWRISLAVSDLIMGCIAVPGNVTRNHNFLRMKLEKISFLFLGIKCDLIKRSNCKYLCSIFYDEGHIPCWTNIF